MFEIARYVPLLYSRVAEVKAYRELPDSTKDLIFPVFIARPWPNANSLLTLCERIQEAVVGRRFGLDLDHSKRASDNSRRAQSEFMALFEENDAFKNYFSWISDVEGAVPVAQVSHGEFLDLKRQCIRMQEIGRGGFIRLRYQSQVPIAPVIEAVTANYGEGIAVLVDLGWATSILHEEVWATNVVRQIVEVSPDREIVIAGSSFPDGFAKVASVKDFPIEERQIFTSIRQKQNANLFYGDWGSTREPTPEKTPMRNIPRIDLPTSSFWRVFRSEKSVEESSREEYGDIARRVLDDASYAEQPDLWGKYIIECTAQGLPGEIKSPGTAAAVRVNLHLHRQAHYDTPQLMIQTDEPYID